eukprot:118699_1
MQYNSIRLLDVPIVLTIPVRRAFIIDGKINNKHPLQSMSSYIHPRTHPFLSRIDLLIHLLLVDKNGLADVIVHGLININPFGLAVVLVEIKAAGTKTLAAVAEGLFVTEAAAASLSFAA